ncbi:MAG: hypothetical protein LBT71_11140 [Azoarcus sp.]|nr:hypothetical protein [Azoarcus sp.]
MLEAREVLGELLEKYAVVGASVYTTRHPANSADQPAWQCDGDCGKVWRSGAIQRRCWSTTNAAVCDANKTIAMNDSKGSIWRKWDLHIHTPASLLHRYGADTDAWDKFIDALSKLPPEFKVLGINDYLFIDGYKRILEAKNAGKLPNIDLILPVIELRLDKFGGSKSGLSRVNYHVIFSDEVSPDIIESQFLNVLCSKYVLTPEHEALKWAAAPTRQSIEDLGKKIIESVPESKRSNYSSPLQEGFNNFCVSLDSITEILERPCFKGKVLTAVGKTEWADITWNDQSIADKKTIINSADLVFISSLTVDDCIKAKKSLTDSKVNDRLLDCSDAHSYADSTEKDRLGKCFTWIKADTTFQGLRQILNESDDRVFIGDKPPSLVRASQHPTRVIESIEIKKSSAVITPEKWFNCSIPLNAELIAVIGNKGSGKSALSDILGLLGNTPQHNAFSFLNSKKFRHPKSNKANQFQASLSWADGTVDSVPNLALDPAQDAIEKVKYIPQNYLEDICNEIGSGKGSQFYNELQQVIFSHVHEAERLGFETLDELLEHRSTETNQAIAQLVAELRERNARIVTTEEQALPHYRKTIESQLAEKTRELDAHTATRPTEVKKPDADPAVQQHSKEATEELGKKQEELKNIENEIATLKADNLIAAKKHVSAEKLIGKLENLKRYVKSFIAEAKPELDELGIVVADVVTFEVKPDLIIELLKTQTTKQTEITQKLSTETNDGHEFRRRAVMGAIEELKMQLSAPQRAYQESLQALKEWESVKTEIIGTDESPGTIKYLNRQLNDLENLPAQLRTLRKERNRKMLEIFSEKQKLRCYFENYYGAVQNFLKKHPLAASGQFKLTFNVSMAESEFSKKFLGHLNRRKSGPFMGDEDGEAEMRKLIDNTNFDCALGTLRFAKTLFAKMIEHDGKTLLVKDQLKQGVTVQEIYDFVFSLDFLSPIYNLQWDGKGLEQLSPGERGNLLLIFYLLVDRDNIPLIIDQPEENLDNQTVYKILVPCIKDAKKRRQIVIVTHNPNLAVVCDAEQIICAEMDKENFNAVTYTSGSIENCSINKRIVDILEGTRPAFDKRDDKYIP